MNYTLQHIGVMGMRWGHRKTSSSTSSSDHVISRNLKKKKLHEMSNAEILALTSRMQLERQYKNLNPGKLVRGKKAVKKVLEGIAEFTLAVGTITAGAAAGKKVLDYVNKQMLKNVRL